MVRRKKKKLSSKSLVLILSIVCIATLAWYLWKREGPRFLRYKEFGIDIPSNYGIHGIDVSKYQSYIDWEEVKMMQVAGVQIGFAFIKATEGLNDVDRYFKRNWKKAKQANVITGAYHFFIAPKSGKAQARHFIKVVHLDSGDLPPVIDVEQAYGASRDKLRKNVKEFLDTVEEYYGVKPIIYTNVDFYDHYLKGAFDDYPLWVAHYLQKNQPRIKRDWIFWQHSEQGRVNGILTKVDFNVFNGDSSDFRKMLIN